MKRVGTFLVAGMLATPINLGHVLAQTKTPATPPTATVPITSQTPAGVVDSMPAAAPVPAKKKKRKLAKADKPEAYANSAKANNAAYEKQKAAAAAKSNSTPDPTKQPQ